ncbi:hypothetical protein PMZ80_004598 [Knufia obscura]|uniref:Uncharacterized protein n=1 Tax=Knufia obscura TaxID=1635080 RepID=A0ABR0RSL5_9EURO|nr:hypothetical protein PMZ80_004598 [Knufia obscura]
MTQLTYYHRSAFSRQKPGSQRDPSLSPDSASEGDAHVYMARVRRNSQTGRKRHGSEQPESQRSIRPKAVTDANHLLAQTQPYSQATYASDHAVQYRGIPPPPQLVTSNWGYGQQQSFADARSPEGLGSPEHSTAGYSNYESSSFASDRNRTLSPLEYTPTHSAVSVEPAGSQDGLSAFLSNKKRSDSGSTNFLDRTLHHGASEPLAGIDAICDGDLDDWSLPRIQESAPPSSMMLPSGLQHVRDLDEPWSPLEVEDGGAFGGPAPSRPSHPPRVTQTPAPPIIRMPSRGAGRPGRRQGPLSLESRQNANDVRKERDKPRFAISLDIGLGPPLVLPVREFLPIGELNRPAYLPVENGSQTTAVPITMYDLPVVISCDKEEEAAKHIRGTLLRWFQRTIDCTQEGDWAWHWFNKGSDAFAGSIMKHICDYFKGDIPQHKILRDALALSFFNYIFIYSFNVPDKRVDDVQRNLESRIPQDAEYISPSIINLYVKMLMLPPLRDVVKRTLKALELLLLEQQNARQWRRDLIFCVSFIVLAYLGRTQVSVLQFANQPARDSATVLTHQAATQQVLEMEHEVADLIIKYHEQFLTPSPRRKASAAVATAAEQACEEHAQKFGLMERIQKIKADNLKNMPNSLDPQCDHVGDFIANNTNRICWKFVHAVIPDTGFKREADTAMVM